MSALPTSASQLYCLKTPKKFMKGAELHAMSHLKFFVEKDTTQNATFLVWDPFYLICLLVVSYSRVRIRWKFFIIINSVTYPK